MNRAIPTFSLGAILLLVIGFYLGWSLFVDPDSAPRPLRPSIISSGSIRGRITFDGPVPVARKYSTAGFNAEPCPHSITEERLEVGPSGGLKNAVVTVHGVPGDFKVTDDGGWVLDQVGCVFKPHILLVVKGAKISIKNSDKVAHNVNILGKKNWGINEAMIAGSVKTVSFAEAERMPVNCSIHPWMSAWIVVHENYYFAVTDTNGEFAIGGIPPGEYPVRIWHESARLESWSMKVDSGEAVILNLALTPK